MSVAVLDRPRTNPTCGGRYHGTHSAYTFAGCRCPEAREGHRLYRKRLREGRKPVRFTDGAGTANRLRALMAIGYDGRTLARHLGSSANRVGDLVWRRKALVHVRVAAVVRDLYDRLAATPAPAGYPASRALSLARRNGWQPPAEWAAWGPGVIDLPDPDPDPDFVDEEKVRRAVAGWPVELNDAELLVAVARVMAVRGVGMTRACDRLSVNRLRVRRLMDAAKRKAAA